MLRGKFVGPGHDGRRRHKRFHIWRCRLGWALAIDGRDCFGLSEACFRLRFVVVRFSETGNGTATASASRSRSSILPPPSARLVGMRRKQASQPQPSCLPSHVRSPHRIAPRQPPLTGLPGAVALRLAPEAQREGRPASKSLLGPASQQVACHGSAIGDQRTGCPKTVALGRIAGSVVPGQAPIATAGARAARGNRPTMSTGMVHANQRAGVHHRRRSSQERSNVLVRRNEHRDQRTERAVQRVRQHQRQRRQRQTVGYKRVDTSFIDYLTTSTASRQRSRLPWWRGPTT